jgi:hypothetical protein
MPLLSVGYHTNGSSAFCVLDQNCPDLNERMSFSQLAQSEVPEQQPECGHQRRAY